jgi:hypothetical protein
MITTHARGVIDKLLLKASLSHTKDMKHHDHSHYASVANKKSQIGYNNYISASDVMSLA